MKLALICNILFLNTILIKSCLLCRKKTFKDIMLSSFTTPCLGYNVNDPPIVFTDTRGNLGNKMFTYILAYLVREIFGLEVYIGHYTWKHLSEIFENVSEFPVAQHSICGFSGFYTRYRNDEWKNIWDVIARKKQEEEVNLKNLINLTPGEHTEEVDTSEPTRVLSQDQETPIRSELQGYTPHPWEIFSGEMTSLSSLLQPGRALILFPVGYSHAKWYDRFHHDNPWDTYPGLLDFALKSFKFKKFYREQAEASLLEIKKDFLSKRKEQDRAKNKKKKKKKILEGEKEKSKNEDEVVFVGIHNRRTDHLKFQKDVGFIPVKTSYFLESMELFREEYKNVVFIYVSDDMTWAKENILPRIRTEDLYLAGSLVNPDLRDKPYFSATLDLALLAACNHTIVTYGTYTFWAGFLSGNGTGTRVLPQFNSEYRREFATSPYYLQHPLHTKLPRFYFGMNRM
ncbi:uncharacterized protein LOC111714792 [Eurytemora carolleeae]|uniref:uncharacterized protein LOC111714792 n=1 Tax=Eurytemora carolleeae TaxID=1294199 RepID=UPI000C77E569|nr:uncharacterized protein LOC111714792 [Eurytemora carolleeae]|eukprot:XP_023345764.1 uncharacterized protein LOC111714792 [Eurytemora affinis]